MTPESQRIAIAETCGGKNTIYLKPGDGYYWQDPKLGFTAPVPDYLNDLNAMHEAEKYAQEHLFNADQWEQYGLELEKQHLNASIRGTDGKPDYYDFATLMCELTAAQRAEAFLRTLNLWKDEV